MTNVDEDGDGVVILMEADWSYTQRKYLVRAMQRSWAVVTELRGVWYDAGETPLGWEVSRPRGAVLPPCHLIPATCGVGGQ